MTDERTLGDEPSDAPLALQTASEAVENGLVDSSAIVSAVEDAWRGEPDVFVTYVTRYLVEVAGADERVADDVAELLATVAAGERSPAIAAIDNLSNLGDADPGVLRWLFGRLAASVHPDTGSLGTTDAVAVVAAIGRAGVENPGVATEVIPTLVAWVDASKAPVSVEAMWTLTRLYHAERGVIRPFVAERAWQLDAEDATAVAEALAELGAVGWAVPDAVVGVDRVRNHLTHPDASVREAAARTVGRIGGQPPVEGERRGRAAPDAVDDLLPETVELLDDPERDVRSAAAGALEAIAREAPALVAPVRETLVATVESATPSAVDSAAIRTMVHLVGHVDDADPAVWALPTFERLLAADDADPGTYRAAGAGVAAVAGATETDCSAAVTDALRARPAYGNDECERAAGPIPDLAREVDEPDVVVENATAALDDEDDAVRLAAVRVLGAFVTHDLRTRETILAGFDRRLGDQNREVRRAVYLALIDLVQEVPETHGVVADMLREHVQYGGDRGAAVDVLVHADDAPLVVAEALAVLCALPHPDERRLESVSDAVYSLATGVPEAAVLATDALTERLDGRDAVSTAAASALTVALDAGATLDASEIERLRGAACDDASPVSLQRAAALALITAGEDDAGTERERLRELMYEDPARGLDALDTAAEHAADDLERVMSCVAYGNVNNAPTAVGAAGAISLGNAVHAQLDFANYASTVFGQAGSVTAFDGLEHFAERFPHAVPPTAATPRALLLSAGSEAAQSSLDVAEARGILTESIRERWHRHPVPAVRERVVDVETALDEWSIPDVDPSAIDREALDETAAALAAPTPDAETAVREQLVAVATNTPRLAARVCEHLLLRFAALDAGERRAGTADALLNVLPDCEHADAVTGDERALVAAMDAPSATVRAKALAAVASLENTPSERLAEVALAHVTDDESVVRDHAMNAMRVAAHALDGDAIPVDSVVDRLSDDATVASTSQDAFRSAIMAAPERAPAFADALEAQLDDAEHVGRDTRQVGAFVLGCAAYVDPTLRGRLPDVLLPLLDGDGTARRTVLFALQLTPVDAVTDAADAADHLCLALRDESDDTGCYAGGDLLERLARHDPAAVDAHLPTLADALTERSVVQSVVAERAAYRALAVLLDEGEATVDPFTDLLHRIASSPGHRHHTDDDSPTSDDRVALARAATAAAGRAGLGCYIDVLGPGDGVRETPDPDVTAQFLLVAEDADRADALEAIGEYGQSVRRAVVRSVLERADARPTSDVWPATADVLDAFLPRLDDTAVRRDGVAATVEALDASGGDARRRAAETLAALARRDVLPAEEAVAHLLGALADADRDVRSTVADALADVTRAARLPDTSVVESLAVRTSSASSEAFRCGGATALGVLGVRSLNARSEAVDALATATKDGARSVRRAAVRGLAEIARVDGDAVAVVADRLRTLAAADDSGLQEDARRCLYALGE